MSHTENTPLLEVRNLKKYFGKKDRVLHAVDDISVTIQQGKTLGVVGELLNNRAVRLNMFLLLIRMSALQEIPAVSMGKASR